MRVETSPCMPVALRFGSRMLGFGPEKAPQIIERFLHGTATEIRVRFWPYDATVDMGDMPLSGFPQAMEKLKGCAVAAR